MSTDLHARSDAAPAKFEGRLSAIHLPTRDAAESRHFFVDVLGGEPVSANATTAHIRFVNVDIVVHAQTPSGATPYGREYPHYAFGVDAEQFVAIKRRLDAFKVPTNEPWTRWQDPYVIMYFRDPSGNQYELFATEGVNGMIPVRVGKRFGGDYTIDFEALSYERFERPIDAGAHDAPPTRTNGFNHLTMPVQDLEIGKRFLIQVLDGEEVLYLPNIHFTATIGGADIGIAPQSNGYTGFGERFPNLEFTVSQPVLLSMWRRLRSMQIPASPIATESGEEALLYFRDPSGNLWKLSCREPSPDLVASAVAEASVDVGALAHEWK